MGESTPTEAKYEVPLPLVEVGVSRLDEERLLIPSESNLWGIRKLAVLPSPDRPTGTIAAPAEFSLKILRGESNET